MNRQWSWPAPPPALHRMPPDDAEAPEQEPPRVMTEYVVYQLVRVRLSLRGIEHLIILEPAEAAALRDQLDSALRVAR